MATFQIVTPASQQPVTIAEAKEQLRVDHSEEDAFITNLIKTATAIVEDLTNRKCLPTVISEYFDSFPCEMQSAAGSFVNEITLRWSPVKKINKIIYYDVDNAERDLSDETDFHAEIYNAPTTLTPVTNWPATYDRKRAVKIEYEAGYADAASVAPQLKQAILLLIGEMYENRENHVKKIPTAVDHLITQMKVWI